MLVCGIQHAKGVSKKTQQPYDAYVLHGLSRRFNGDIVSESAWITPAEFDRTKPAVGDLIMISRDGEVLIRDSYGEKLQIVLDLL